MTPVAIAIPILWTFVATAIPDVVRACIAGGSLLAACVWGMATGSTGASWLALNMGTGALVALVCRYPRHGGEAHRESVPLYEDIAFGAGVYGLLTCLCRLLYP